MSISTNSTNGDFTPTEGEVNCESISLDNDGQSDGKVTDQQQQKEFREKCAKMEMEFKITKLELENKLLQETLNHKELMQKTLLERICELEKEVKGQKKGELSEYGIVEKIEELFAQMGGEMEKQQTMLCSKIDGLVAQQTVDGHDLESVIKTKVNNVLEEQQKKMDNFIVTLKERTNELLKAVQQNVPLTIIAEKLSNNYWDGNACHNDLEIVGPNKTRVNYQKNGNADWTWRSVFAKHPILQRNDSPNIFYFEISVLNLKSTTFFGFAFKDQEKLNEGIFFNSGTYACVSNGHFWFSRTKRRDAQYAYGCGDTVGFGVNLATRKLIFTKNGLLSDTADLFIDSSFSAGSLFPFISLCSFGDKIEANFGPNFKFDVAKF
ncbi:hypothetical protein niasHS_012808 [Heterodera schachtii]|uniref:B30.2/SPRY domain-containing protein n=1 Tax=Heterodera schachtii TaxID=97005 RepID=A0ABD2IJ62_HETSC